MGLITLAKNFCHWTISVVIAGHLAKTNNIIWRAFWSVLLIVTIIAFCLHCTMNIIEFLAYEKTTVIRLYSLPTAPFPAVTICNLNPFKQSRLDKSSSLSNLISAYKYTLDQKSTSENTATIAAPTNVRRKRQTCGSSFQASIIAPSESIPQNYTVTGCNGAIINVTYQMCNDPSKSITLFNINKPDFNTNKVNIEKGIYYCFHDYVCADLCNTWDNGLSALLNFTNCAKLNFAYPPDTGGFNFMALIAESYSMQCSKSDELCELGYYKKSSIKYPGNYWYYACPSTTSGVNDVNITMEGCDGSNYLMNRITTTTTNPSACPSDYKNISDAFSNAMDETDCISTCGKSCPYTGSFNFCDFAQTKLCKYYKTCATSSTEETTLASTTEVSKSTTVKISTLKPTTKKLTTKKLSTETTETASTNDHTTSMIETPTYSPLPGLSTLPSVKSTTTDESGSTTTTTTRIPFPTHHQISTHSTTESARNLDTSATPDEFTSTEAPDSTTLKPTTDVDPPTNNPEITQQKTSTFESPSSSKEPPTTSTKLSSVASTSKASTFTAPTSTKNITSSTTLSSTSDSKTSSASSTKTSLTPNTSKISTQSTSKATIISSTKLSSASNFPTKTKAATTTKANPSTAATTVKSTIGVTTVSSIKISSTSTKLSTATTALSSTNKAITVSTTTNASLLTVLTSKNVITSTPSITKPSSTVTPTIKTSATQTQQTNPSSMASTSNFLNTSPTKASGSTPLNSIPSLPTTKSVIEGTTGETKGNIETASSDLTSTNPLLQTTTGINDESQTTQFKPNTAESISLITTTSIMEANSSTKNIDKLTTSLSYNASESPTASTISQKSKTSKPSAITLNAFTTVPTSKLSSSINLITTNAMDKSSSVLTSSLNGDIILSSTSNAMSPSFQQTFMTTVDGINDDGNTKAIIQTTASFLNTSQGDMGGSASKVSSPQNSTVKGWTSETSTNSKTKNLTGVTSTTKTENNPNITKNDVSTSNTKMVTNSASLTPKSASTSITKNNTTIKEQTTKPTDISEANTKSSSSPFSFASNISGTTKPSSIILTTKNDSTFTPSNPINASPTTNLNQSTTLLSNSTTFFSTTTKVVSSSPISNTTTVATVTTKVSYNSSSNTTGANTKQSTVSPVSPSTSTDNTTFNLQNLSKIYNLNSSQESLTIETNAQNSLITIAASFSDAEKQALGYQMSDLIQTCIIDGVPCNIDRDFSQIYDVDYGYCYTFNYELFYNTTRMGTNHGLKMVVLSDINEYLATSSEQGIKVVVHYQNQSPFPNVDGYRCATGKAIDLRVIYGIVSRLDAPYGECNDLDKLKELNQPFYFPGTYTVEGCYRSCFQQKVSKACNCSDPRFPLPSDLSTAFCQNTDRVKYACYEQYIEDNGDYYNVEGCTCSVPCNDITYDASVYYSNWPYGTYFYQAFCTNATLLNGSDCRQYYQDNGVLVQVSYARLGYESIEETPVTSGSDLFNNLAGNTGLWIGFTAVTAAELALIFIQISLWICTKKAELKEVPSCRRRNYTSEGDFDTYDDRKTSDVALIGGFSGTHAAKYSGVYNNPFQKSFFNNSGFNETENFNHLYKPKNFANNDLRRRANSNVSTMLADPNSLYEPIIPVSHIDVYDSQLIPPALVQSNVNNSVPEM